MQDLQNNIENYLTSLNLNFYFSGSSDTNGTSIYYMVALPNSEDYKKVRFSDHGISNVNRLAEEICFKLYDFEKKTNMLMCLLGHPNYALQPVEFKTTHIEVLKLNEGVKPISTRVTKKGNTLYTIAINKPVSYDYIKI